FERAPGGRDRAPPRALGGARHLHPRPLALAAPRDTAPLEHARARAALVLPLGRREHRAPRRRALQALDGWALLGGVAALSPLRLPRRERVVFGPSRAAPMRRRRRGP